jgi:dynein regulatory complex protein 1
VSKVVAADELITTQQLGLDWQPPDLRGLRFRTADNQPPDDATAASAGDATAAFGGAASSPASSRAVSGAKMFAMMRLLVDEAQFLVDGRVQAALAAMPREDVQLAQAESMLRALGVENEGQVASLLAYFFPQGDGDDDDDDEGDGDSVDAVPSLVKELRQVIEPDRVVAALAAFVETRKAQRAAGADAAAAGARAAASGASTVGDKSVAASEGAVVSGRREEKAYWVRAAAVVREEKVAMWTSLEAALVKYNGVLTDRSDAIEEVEILQQKNDALKELLSTYLSARVNEELIVPPNKTIQLGGP